MRQAIEDLVDRYEAGTLTRRRRVQGLAVFALGGRPPQIGATTALRSVGDQPLRSAATGLMRVARRAGAQAARIPISTAAASTTP